jgi:hypothetical protein
LGRELREPPTEGVHRRVADRLLRGRIAVAASCAVVGLAGAFGIVPWRAAPLLVAALLIAVTSLAFAVTSRRLERGDRQRDAAIVVILLSSDAVALLGVAASAGGPGLALLLAAIAVGSIFVHAVALVRVATAPPPAARAPPRDEAIGSVEQELLVELVAAGARAREAAGIVRARAEALRLSVAESGASDVVLHDLEVLVRQAEECQRLLRELEVSRPARLPLPEPCPSESTPLPS